MNINPKISYINSLYKKPKSFVPISAYYSNKHRSYLIKNSFIFAVNTLLNS